MSAEITPSYDKNRTQLSEVLPLDTPFTVILDAAERCNFRCSYCFRANPDADVAPFCISGKLMDWNIFALATDQLAAFPKPVRTISLSCHGEPLCNPALPDMVRHLKEKGFSAKVSIHTNGALLTPELAWDLADSGIDRVVFSIQGLSEESYRNVCGAKIDFDVFLANLALFYSLKTHTLVNAKIVDIALDKGEEERFYELFSPVADQVFVEKTVPIWDATVDSEPPREQVNKYGQNFPHQQCCPLVFHTLVVTPEGDIYPCTQPAQKMKLGNLHSNVLSDAWNGEPRRRWLEKQLTLSPSEVCDACYIPQNSIFSSADMIDDSRLDILARLRSD